jgi:hypothetical protein
LGKTVSESWIAGRLINDGHAAAVIGPKGDGTLELDPHDARRGSLRDLRVADGVGEQIASAGAGFS